MNDLISREALKKAIEQAFETADLSEYEACICVSEIYDKEIDNAPTVELCYQTTSCLDCKNYDKENHNCPRYCEVIKEALEETKKPQGEWIPVSERLPDKNMPCLVSVGKFNFIQIAMYSNLMETIDHKIFYQGDYGKNNFQNITEYVNAWQPLPEPYKKGDTEE